MLRSGELLVRNDTVLVLILVAEDLLDELVLVCLHLVGLLRLGSSCRPDLLNLWGKYGGKIEIWFLLIYISNTSPEPDLLLQVSGQLLPVDVVVGVGVDLLEDVDGRGALLGVDELNVEDERGPAGDDVTGALLAVCKLGGNGEPPLLADAHSHDALVPAFDHLNDRRWLRLHEVGYQC